MSENIVGEQTKTCPMCGATVVPLDRKCPECGESFLAADGSGDAYADGTTERELRTFVGRRATYYLGKWRAALEGGKGTGFNLAAFLFSAFWLPYRKMYRVTLIFYGAIIAESLAEEALFVWILGRDEVPGAVDKLSNLIIGAICGAFANQWYLAHARKEISKLRSEGLPEEEYFQKLARRGGTSLLAGLGCIVLFLAVAIGILAAAEMFAPGE
jgi:ribosomal protein S27AE